MVSPPPQPATYPGHLAPTCFPKIERERERERGAPRSRYPTIPDPTIGGPPFFVYSPGTDDNLG